jgi:hypothetical protein
VYPQSNKKGKGKEKKRKERKRRKQTHVNGTNHNIIPFVGLKTLQSIMLFGIVVVGRSGQFLGK